MSGLPQNISKSAFRKGEYVGHCCGAQRIVRHADGWYTQGLVSCAGKPVYVHARTLAELGAKLEAQNA